MSMRIGVCTTDFEKNFGALPVNELFAKMKNLKFEVTQLSFASVKESNFTPTGQIEIPNEISDDLINIISEASKKYNIPIIACNGTFNMAHPDASVRAEGVRRFEILAQAAKKLGCELLSLCSGTRFEDYLWSYHKDNDTPEAWADMIDTVKKISAIAEKYDIMLAVETEAANVIDTPEKAQKMMGETGSPNLKMIMDCANLFHVGEAKRANVESVISHAFEVFGKDVISAHSKDIAESDEIDFCATGEGIVDYKLFIELLDKYGYKGDMLLHGIFDEDKMSKGYEIIKNLI